MTVLLPHNDGRLHRNHRRSQRPRHRGRGGADDHPRRSCRRHALADRARTVEVAGRLTDDGQRGVADTDGGRCDRCPRPTGHVRATADRAGFTASLPSGHGGARPLCTRPFHRHSPIGVATGSRPGRCQGQPPVVDVELPRPSGAATTRGAPHRRLAVQGRSHHGRRRGDGCPRPRRPGDRPPRRSRDSRTSYVPAVARSARRARCGGDRRRSRPRRSDRVSVRHRVDDASRLQSSSSRVRTTRRGSPHRRVVWRRLLQR